MYVCTKLVFTVHILPLLLHHSLQQRNFAIKFAIHTARHIVDRVGTVGKVHGRTFLAAHGHVTLIEIETRHHLHHSGHQHLSLFARQLRVLIGMTANGVPLIGHNDCPYGWVLFDGQRHGGGGVCVHH